MSTPRALTFWMVNSDIPMFRIRIFMAGSLFLCSRKTLMPCSLAWSVSFRDTLDEGAPGFGVKDAGKRSLSLPRRARL